MKLIKLDAIGSTNDFLKGLASKQFVENFTVVTAEIQTKGKGANKINKKAPKYFPKTI